MCDGSTDLIVEFLRNKKLYMIGLVTKAFLAIGNPSRADA